MKTSYLFFSLSLSFLCSCQSNDEVFESNWKYIEGYHFGDFLYFDSQKCFVNGDTIFKQQVPFAIIKDLDINILPGTENKLTLKNIKTGELGLYTDKEE